MIDKLDPPRNTPGDDQREAATNENEAQLRLLLGTQAMWQTDADGVVVADSPSWRAFTGQTLEEWLGYGWVNAVHPGDRAYAERQWREAVAEAKLVNAEFRLRAPDGGWRWTNVRAVPVLDANGRIVKWTGMNLDIDERKRAEAALSEGEKLQTFLLKLSDTMRAELDADAIANRALEMLSDHLALDRCYITYYRPDDDEAVFPYQIGNDTVPPLPAKVRLSDFPDAYEQVLDRTFVIEDDFERRGLSEAERANSKALGMRAMVASTVRMGERRPLCSMAAISSTPRRWTPTEIALVEETAERTWVAIERTRAEAALRESEERFQQFAKASASGLWIRDAGTLAMEYVSPAFGTIYGVETDALLGDVKRWAFMIAPEDRDAALGHLEAARNGDVAVHEFRIQRPTDLAFRWIRNTDFPLRDNGHILRIGGIAQDVTEAKMATERQDVLVAELQHRTRNLIAVVQGIADETMEETGPTEAFRPAFSDRLSALSRVQGLLSRSESEPITIASLLRLELDALGAGAASGRVIVAGPEVFLRPSTVQTLALALHELATNARKYGALSHEHGQLAVTWSERSDAGEPRLVLDWVETGLEHAPSRTQPGSEGGGYGRELIEQALPHALGAKTTYALTATGLRCTIDLPSRPASRNGTMP